jgi:hypothetical protein
MPQSRLAFYHVMRMFEIYYMASLISESRPIGLSMGIIGTSKLCSWEIRLSLRSCGVETPQPGSAFSLQPEFQPRLELAAPLRFHQP